MAKEIVIEYELLLGLYWGNQYSTCLIGKIFKCSDNCIARKMRQYGIPRRTLSERTKLQRENRQRQDPIGLIKQQVKFISSADPVKGGKTMHKKLKEKLGDEKYSKRQSKIATKIKEEKWIGKCFGYIKVRCSCGCKRMKRIKPSVYKKNKTGHFFYTFECYTRFRRQKKNWRGKFPGKLKKKPIRKIKIQPK